MKDLNEELSKMGMKLSSQESNEDREARIKKNYDEYMRKLNVRKPSELTLEMYRQGFNRAYFQATGNAWNKDSNARAAIVQLAQWFSGEISMPHIKSDKGIFLYGTFGTGKTSIISIHASIISAKASSNGFLLDIFSPQRMRLLSLSLHASSF